jgi:hypothetical protein
MTKMLIMMTSGPETPHRLGMPFFQAMAAMAIDAEEVVMVFTMDGTLLLKQGVAQSLYIKPGVDKSVHQFMQEAHDYGVKFYVCPSSLELHDLAMNDLIPECDGAMGAAAYSALGFEDDVLTLCY